MRILIIEDEKWTAKDLSDTLQKVEPTVEIVALLHSVEEALTFFKQGDLRIDLIFSDIELGDGLSFDIFKKIENNVPVIFCTAYQQYSLEAFNTMGIDYILKPFNEASIAKTLKKYQAFKKGFSSSPAQYETLLSLLTSDLNKSVPSIIIHQNDRIIPIKGSEIALFYIKEASVFAYTFTKQEHRINKKLDVLEKQFFPHFFRANRQFLVNRKAVQDASQYFNRKLLVNLNLSFPEKIIVGKLKASDFIKWMSEY